MKNNYVDHTFRFLAIGLLAAFVLAGPLLAQDNSEASEAFEQGMTAFRAGRLEETIIRLEDVVVADPNYLNAVSFRTVALLGLHELTDAEAYLSIALQGNHDSIVLLGAKAFVLTEAGKLSEARGVADSIIELPALTAWDYEVRAGAYMMKGKIGTAIRNFSRAIEMDPGRAEFYVNRGLAFGKQRDFHKEISDHSKAIEIDPQAAVAYLNRGTAYYNQKKYADALRDYDQALELNDTLPMAYVNRGAIRRIQKNITGAFADYDRAIMIDPKLPIAYYNRGIAWRKNNDFAKAIDDYTEAITLRPNYQAAFLNRGVAYIKIGAYSKACSDWRSAYKIDSGTPEGQMANRNVMRHCSH